MPKNSPEKINLPPGPKGSLFLGSTFGYLRDQIGFLTAAVKQYGDVVRLRLGNQTTYILYFLPARPIARVRGSPCR
jgi:hypothetical protein